MIERPKILIIIPAFNESGNIQATIKEIKSLSLMADLVVINDGSSDTTAQEAHAAGAAVISLPCNLGIGGAVQTGFQYAVSRDYDVAVQVDGDGQHDAHYLTALWKPVLNQTAEMVVGSRFLVAFTSYRSSWLRQIGIFFFARLISFLIRCPITDPTSGFRAYGRRAIRIFAQDYPQDFPEPEAIVVAKRAGLKVMEIPVEMRKRHYGQSSIRYLRTFYYMVKVTLAILLNMLKKKRKVE